MAAERVKSTSYDPVHQDNNKTTELNSTLGDIDDANQLCTPETIAMCSRFIYCSGDISRSNAINKNKYKDQISDDEEGDETFISSLRSKIEKDLTNFDDNKKSKLASRYSQKRKSSFDDHSEKLIKRFKDDVKYKKLELQKKNNILSPVTSSTKNFDNDINNHPAENRPQNIIAKEISKENRNVATPSNFKINIKSSSNTSSKLLYQVTSTVAKDIRSSANQTTILETEIEEFTYFEIQCLTPPQLATEDEA